MIQQRNSTFHEMIQLLRENNLYKEIIFSAQKKYSIKLLKLETFSPTQVFQLAKKLTDRNHSTEDRQESSQKCCIGTTWGLNQFKLFSWISVCYAFLIKKQLTYLNFRDYTFLNSFFPSKSLQFLQYHIKSLIPQYKSNSKKWSQEQIQLLKQSIAQEQGKLRWSEISFAVFSKSNGEFYRTPQKCREMWINHLDPEVNRSKWTVPEDLLLFKAVSQYGTKWSHISKILKGVRTEHMVKNRYNSMHKCYQNKSQRATSKKILDKIIDDLQRKKDQLQQRKQKQLFLIKRTTSFSQDLQDSPRSQVSLEQLLSFSNNQIQFQQSKIVYKQQNIPEKGKLDLHEIMFSETAVQIDSPSPTLIPMEMVEVQLFTQAYKSKQDQDISSLFL